jgi:two-component system, NarL family, invasion response regulator UvrY
MNQIPQRETVCARATPGPHDELPDRQFTVFVLLARGDSASTVARALGRSPKTVSTHRDRVLEHLQLKTNADLTAYALRYGVLENWIPGPAS